jgi:FkbM family methyltransferase
VRTVDPLYQYMLPATFELSVADQTAEFDSGAVHFDENRYKYPFESEKSLLARLLSEVQADETFWDVGASLGLYSVFVGLVLTEGEVVAFEPHPQDARFTSRNLRLNGLDDRSEVVEVALASERGRAELQNEPRRTGRQLTTERGSSPTVTVTTHAGDTLVAERGLPTPDVMKIDVEGAEGEVIGGLSNVLAETPPRLIYCEIHTEKIGEFGTTVDQFTATLKEYGYALEELESRRKADFIRCER